MVNRNLLKVATQALELSPAFFVLHHPELDLVMRRTFLEFLPGDDAHLLMGV